MASKTTIYYPDSTNGAKVDFELTKTSPANNSLIGMANVPVNKHLKATIFEVVKTNGESGAIYTPAKKGGVVAFLEDGDFNLENQYSTPFENSNPEGRMPNMMGMIQQGQISESLSSFFSSFGANANLGELGETLEGLEGRTTFTKINSQQIYTSSNSIRISGTLVFSAWQDARKEVEMALQKLQSWATPKMLADQSALMNAAQDRSITGLFASEVPCFVGMRYGGKTYMPLIIESLSAPIVAPMNKNGDRLALKSQINLCSLQAWDRQDIAKLYGS